jgi:catechol 2,3-dioxygenase-like lactoylglutathione lyase family enzyme
MSMNPARTFGSADNRFILERIMDLFCCAHSGYAACGGNLPAVQTHHLLRKAPPSQRRSMHLRLLFWQTVGAGIQMKRNLHLFYLVLLLALPSYALSAAVSSVGAVGMTVSDLDRAVTFYSALTFQKVSDIEVFGDEYEQLVGVFGARMRIVRMQLGNEFIELTEYLTPRGRPIPIDSRSNDLWFQHIAIVVSDMTKAFHKLRELKVQFVSTGPQRLPDWNTAAAGIEAFYFRDPDQHNLELIYFPSGKGDPRWHQGTGQLFLGLDHTAIAVSNTEASVHFYHDLLGFRKVGESENYGTEQEHLNQVFGAHLHITAMRAESGPGIEFLEYVAPRDGRSRPSESKSNDILNWSTTLEVSDVDGLAQKLREEHIHFVSSNVIVLRKDENSFFRGVLVSDPDGHTMLLTQK